MQKTTVLIVDDQDLFARGLQLVLQGEGKESIEVLGIAANGREAIDLTQRLKPEVILMDIRMPIMDGVEATREISRRFPETKIMILTTFDDDEYAYNALSAGARGFLLKSVPPDELVLSIQALKKDALYIASSVGYKLIDMMRREGVPTESVTQPVVQNLLKNIPDLTPREAEVLTFVAKGVRNSRISEELALSEKTVKNYISSIYEKLDIHNRLQVISYVNELISKNMP